MPLEFGKQAVCVNELGKQAWLGLVSGSKKEESNKEMEEKVLELIKEKEVFLWHLEI